MFSSHSPQPELLDHIFSFLDPLTDLRTAQCVCHTFRLAFINQRIWSRLCAALYPPLAPYIDNMDTGRLSLIFSFYPPDNDLVPLHIACQRLYSSLHKAVMEPPEPYSLIAAPLRASSTDHDPEEGIENTLHPLVRSEDPLCYWSSEGSFDKESGEWLQYDFAHELCIVKEVQLRPYKAYFQRGNPIYAPQRVSFKAMQFTGRPGDDAVQVGPFDWESEEFPVECENDRVQSFRLPTPMLFARSIFQVNLLGRTQTQEADGMYYTCMGYLKVVGCPLYHFTMRRYNADKLAQGSDGGGHYRMEVMPEDELSLQGGLKAMTDCGRLKDVNDDEIDDANMSGEWGASSDGWQSDEGDGLEYDGEDSDLSSIE